MDCVEWKGPGVMIGQDGDMIFVRHGGTYVRVHHSRLRKANAESSEVAGAEIPQQPAENYTGGNMLDMMHLLLIAMWTLTMLLTLWVTIIRMINSHLT